MDQMVYNARVRESMNRASQYQPWDQAKLGRIKSWDAKKVLEKQTMDEKFAKFTEEELSQTSSEDQALERTETVMGTSELYDKNGNLRYVPTPTPDPRDPLNLKTWRKVAALASLCFFGALGLSAETVIGSLMPVFALEYAGIDPKIMTQIDLQSWIPKGDHVNPLAMMTNLPGPPFWKVSLLSSLPILTNGLASYFLVPLSIHVGRRPVLIGCGVLTWVGGMWAALSTSLDQHLAARSLQAIGAGSVEALVPLAVADIVFIHHRNKAMALVWASQGLIIVAFGISAPVVVANYSWRILYWISTALAFAAWLLLCAFLPETRWVRSKEELAGAPIYPVPAGETRARLDPTLGQRTLWTDLGFFVNGYDKKGALKSIIETLKTMFFPNVLWIIMINSMFMSVQNAAQQSASFVLIAGGWKFKVLGLAVLPLVVATPFVWLCGGLLADKVANWHAKHNGGKREPEAHLLNAIIPLVVGLAGCCIFGYAGDNVAGGNCPWIVTLIGIFCISFGFLTANTVLSVYMVESYPQWAGPVLVNVSSFRCVIGFAMSFRASEWITQLGYLGSFAIYSGVLGLGVVTLPIFYFYGKKIRLWTAGTVKSKTKA